MDDNSERVMLLFVPSNKGGHSLLSSKFLCTNSGSIIEFFKNTYNYVIYLPLSFCSSRYSNFSMLYSTRGSSGVSNSVSMSSMRKKRKSTTSSLEKILDAIVLAKNVMPYVCYYSKMLCCIF